MTAKSCLYWNPLGLHGLPQDRFNPADHLRRDSPTLVADTKVFCQNILPKSGSANSEYFEMRAQVCLEAIALTLAYTDGVVTFPRLFEVINLIPGNGPAWSSFGYDMHCSGFPIAKSVEEEIAASRSDASGGMKGVLGETMKAVAPLSDPVLMASLSPPYTASMKDLIGPRPCHIYLMPPPEYIDIWAPVIKAFFVAAMIYKSREPQARQLTLLLDECAQFGKFPLVTRMFTYGAGIGIRPWAVYQSLDQMKATGPDAENIIPSSAAVQSYFGVREGATATRLSKQIGHQTLYFDNELQQERAELARKQAMQNLLTGGDPMRIAMDLSHHRAAAAHRSQQSRELLKPEEILSLSPDRQIIFADGLEHPIFAERRPYYEQRFMAERFYPNPFYPPTDRVRVKTRFGHAWKRVINEPVPHEYADLPQYADGMWSRIEPLRWWQ